MADKLTEAVLEIRTDLTDTMKQMEALKGKLDETGKHTKNVSQLFTLDAVTRFGKTAVEVLGKVGGAVLELSQRGSEVASMSASFEALTASVGETSDAMLGEMRQATSGLVSDMDLMAASNKAILLNLPVTSESMATMAQAATVLGRAMGQDAKKSLDDLTTALGRGSPLILDNLGLTVKVGEANEAYARQLGKSASSLTEGEKKMAFYNAAMAAAEAKVNELGGVHLTLGDRVQQARTMVSNFVDSLAKAVATSPQLSAGLKVVMDLMQGAFGRNQQSTVAATAKAIVDLGVGLTYVGQAGTVAATVLLTAFYGIKTVVLAVETAVVGLLTAIVGTSEGITTFASKIPGLGGKFGEAAEAAHGMRVTLQGMTVDLARQTAEAAKGVAGQSALQQKIDAVGGTLINIRGAMQAASGELSKLDQTARAAKAPLEEQAPRTEAQAQKIADVLRKLQSDVTAIGLVGVQARIAQLDAEYAAEVDKINRLEAITTAERTRALALAKERHDKELELARLGADQIRDTRLKLEQDIALGQTFGVQQRLLELQFARDQEIAQLAPLKLAYGTEYEAIVALVQEKYAQLAAAAQGNFISVQQAAAAAGFATRAELQATAAQAVATYEAMKASGLYTTAQLKEAWEQAEAAKREAKGETATYTMNAEEALLSSATTALQAFGAKSKTAAIAQALISTYQAAAKANSAAPPPFNIALIAAAIAAGMAQVAKIRSTNAFATGTAGLDFADFGRAMPGMLHGEEAVIPRGGGHLLAGEIADALPERGSGRGASGDAKTLAAAVSAALRDTLAPGRPVQLVLEGRRIGEAVLELSRTGALRVVQAAVIPG